jgi:Zn-dependent M28 family amino/carboxypeptidase
MELARAAALSDLDPARTLLFAAWNAEEVGLIGSCYYVYHPTLPVDRTIAMFSIDMVGAGSGQGVQLFGGNSVENNWLVDLLDARVEELGWGYRVVSREPLDASDHVCFFYEGVPAVLVETLGDHAFYHTPDDLPENTSPDNLAAAAYVMWAGLRPLAEGTETQYCTPPPPPVAPVSAELRLRRRCSFMGHHPRIRSR